MVTLADLDLSKPDGATEAVAVLDDYQREAKEATVTSFEEEHSLEGPHAFLKDTTANRPAAAFAGRIYFNTTTGTIQYDNGATWEDLGYWSQRIKIGTFTGDGTNDRTITGVGFTSNLVAVIPLTGTNPAYIKTGDFAANDSHKLSDNTTATDGINAINADGFVVDAAANVNLVVYAYVCLRNNG